MDRRRARLHGLVGGERARQAIGARGPDADVAVETCGGDFSTAGRECYGRDVIAVAAIGAHAIQRFKVPILSVLSALPRRG